MVLFSPVGRCQDSNESGASTPKSCAPHRGSRRNRRRDQSSNRGTALVELAVCLPLIVMVVLASIELCNAKHLKQALTEASYEGAMVGSQPRATEAGIVQRIDAVLAARNIAGSTVTVDGQGTPFDDLLPGDLFTVRVVAPTANNLLGPLQFVTSSELGAEIAGHKQE